MGSEAAKADVQSQRGRARVTSVHAWTTSPALIRLLSITLLAALSLAAQPARSADADDVVRVLERWRQSWLSGKFELNGMARQDGHTHAVYDDLLHPREPAEMRHRWALRQVLLAAVEHQNAAVTHSLIRLGSVGLGRKKIAPERAPFVIRSLVHTSFSRIDDMASVQSLMDVAAGKRGSWRGPLGTEHRQAALRGLGAVRYDVVRPIVERQLIERDPDVRLAAAEALHERRSQKSIVRVADALTAEDDPRVAQVLALGMHAVLERHHARVDARSMRRALSVALETLGRFDWRVDLALVELLGDFRTVGAVPKLIDVLARHQEGRPAEKLSGILQHRAHAVLRNLTGAPYAMEDVAGWQRFWVENQEGFALATPRNGGVEPGRTTSGFFGVPVRGSRVVFVIDTSGSMAATYKPRTTGGRGTTDGSEVQPAPRLDWARRELQNAVGQLPATARFNVVAFSSRARRWRADLTKVSKQSKGALEQRLAKMRPEGGTNIYDALLLALENDVDEIFLLSDGQPSAGDLTNTADIIDAVVEFNRFRKIRVHTIYMGGGGSTFMKELARRNDGRYVHL